MQSVNKSKFKNYTRVARNDDEDEDGEVNIRTNSQYLPYFESTRTDRCIKIFLDQQITFEVCFLASRHIIDRFVFELLFETAVFAR